MSTFNGISRFALVVVFAACFGWPTADAAPRGGRTFLGEGLFSKKGKDESVRWTLADWMTQKRQFRAMDYWLAMNRTLDRFEVNVGGGRHSYDLEVAGSTEEHEVESGSVSLYWSIFGLEYNFENSDEEWTRESGQFNLRLLGMSSQSSNLVLSYGVRKWEWENPVNELSQQFAGANLTLYIVSFLGLDGSYKKFFKAEDKNNTEFESDLVEYGAFIDVYFIRLYGQVFKETTREKDNLGVETEKVRDGSVAGVKFYF